MIAKERKAFWIGNLECLTQVTIAYVLRNAFAYRSGDIFQLLQKNALFFTITADRAQFDLRNSSSVRNFQT